MSVIKVPTSFNIDLDFAIPEFYRRLISLFIDMLIEFFYLRITIEIFEEDFLRLWFLFLLPVLLYHVTLEITMNGQSIGKKLMGIRVVNENGGRPGISQFIIRWLLRISDLWIVFIILTLVYVQQISNRLDEIVILLAVLAFLITDIVLVVSSKKGQRIGDILARTIIIRINTKANIEETVFQEVADNYIPTFPQIMRLSDKDINAVKSILETAKKKGDYQLAAIAADKIKNHLNIRDDKSPFDFLDIVLKDYNYLSVK